MAVYKATYCYPFLNVVDIRVGSDNNLNIPVQYLKCKIDTSNKNISGYKIRIIDEMGNQIFPKDGGEGAISPIQELQTNAMSDVYQANGTNSGINGTYLQIPFFQNKSEQKLVSYNAIYYKAHYKMDYVIMDPTLKGNAAAEWQSSPENIDSWELEGDNLVYSYSNADGTNNIQLDGESLFIGNRVLIVSGRPGDYSKTGLWVVSRKVASDATQRIKTVLTPLTGYNSQMKTNKMLNGEMAVIARGETFHNTIWRSKGDNTYEQVINADNMWQAYENGQLVDVPGFNVDGTSLRWEITLYQGDYDTTSLTSKSKPWAVTYRDLDPQWLDITIGQGQILGSTPERIHIASCDSKLEDKVFPSGGNDVLVLQGRYIDLSSDLGGIFGGVRTYVQNYDSVYGHAYPLKDSLEAQVVNNSHYCQFFKHSNNPEDILNTDIVDFEYDHNIQITYKDSSDWSKVISSDEEFALVKANNRILSISEIPGVADGNTIYYGDKTMPSRMVYGHIGLSQPMTLPITH